MPKKKNKGSGGKEAGKGATIPPTEEIPTSETENAPDTAADDPTISSTTEEPNPDSASDSDFLTGPSLCVIHRYKNIQTKRGDRFGGR